MKTKNILKKNWQNVAIVALVVACIGLGFGLVSNTLDKSETEQTIAETLEDHGITPLTAQEASNSSQTEQDLVFMIEEEKLAHDVYLALYDKWGVNIFKNIKSSETTHQNLVLAVMESRGIADPRQSEAGEFTNPDLQSLYDQLVEQGLKSQADAYQVGIIIEEKDIEDLQVAINNLDPTDSDIKQVFENLLMGSENHLRSFTKLANR